LLPWSFEALKSQGSAVGGSLGHITRIAQMNARFPISVIMGVVFLVAGLCMFAKAYDFVAHATKTTGKVVAIDHGDADGATALHPVFMFIDAAGVEHKCRSPYGSSTY